MKVGLDVTGLSDTEVVHLMQLIDDLKARHNEKE